MFLRSSNVDYSDVSTNKIVRRCLEKYIQAREWRFLLILVLLSFVPLPSFVCLVDVRNWHIDFGHNSLHHQRAKTREKKWRGKERSGGEGRDSRSYNPKKTSRELSGSYFEGGDVCCHRGWWGEARNAMPAGIGASYRSLGDLGEDVYKSTTIVDQTQSTGQSVLESVKKAFSFASPKVEIRKKDPLIEDRRESVSIVSR